MILDQPLLDIAKLIHGEIIGNTKCVVHSLLPIAQAGASDLSFVSNRRYLKAVALTKASALIVSKHLDVSFPTIIVVNNASAAVNTLIEHFSSVSATTPRVSVHPSAVIGNRVVVHDSAQIGAHVVIEDDVVIGANTKIFPNVTIYSGTIIEDHVRIHSGCVLGADGFGYENNKQSLDKIPHAGHVHIESHVEIGANTCIDRARLGVTRIGEGTKIDNLVQIGHGVTIGKHSVICGHTGIAGSVAIGNRVTIAGMCGIADHVHIVDDVILAGNSMVIHDISSPGVYSGYGPLPHRHHNKCQVLYGKLPQLHRAASANS